MSRHLKTSETRSELGIHFSFQLLLLKKKKKITYSKLLKTSGLSEKHLNRIIKSDCNPTLFTINTLSNTLGVDMGELLQFDYSLRLKRIKKEPFIEVLNGPNPLLDSRIKR